MPRPSKQVTIAVVAVAITAIVGGVVMLYLGLGRVTISGVIQTEVSDQSGGCPIFVQPRIAFPGEIPEIGFVADTQGKFVVQVRPGIYALSSSCAEGPAKVQAWFGADQIELR